MARKALLFGIATYVDPELESLKKPHADVQEIGRLLEDDDHGGFDTVTVLRDVDWHEGYAAITKIFNQSGADDVVLVLFAGHAVRNTSGDLYLAFTRTETDNLEGTSVPAFHLARLMDTSKVATQVLILDCCFSGSFPEATRGVTSSAAPVRDTYSEVLNTPYGNKAVLTATDVIQYAYEKEGPEDTSEFSLFSRHLVAGIRGLADTDTDGIVGLAELYEHVLAECIASSVSQTPQLLARPGQRRGEVAISRNSKVHEQTFRARIKLEALLLLSSKDRFEVISGHLDTLPPELPQKLDLSDAELETVLRELVFRDPSRHQRDWYWQELRSLQAKPSIQDVTEPRDASNLLPAPFEWCDIPQGSIMIGRSGLFDVPPIRISKYPITVDQFQVFLDADDGYGKDEWWRGLAERQRRPYSQWAPVPRLPRVYVNWYEAVAFTRWLTARTEQLVRLPLEWEWEWAASNSNGETSFPWGDAWSRRNANVRDSGIGQITPVDDYQHAASQFGVVDMSGNIWERCLNLYETPGRVSYSGAQLRTMKGGSYRYPNWKARISHRHACLPNRRFDDGGFRICSIGSS